MLYCGELLRGARRLVETRFSVRTLISELAAVAPAVTGLFRRAAVCEPVSREALQRVAGGAVGTKVAAQWRDCIASLAAAAVLALPDMSREALRGLSVLDAPGASTADSVCVSGVGVRGACRCPHFSSLHAGLGKVCGGVSATC